MLEARIGTELRSLGLDVELEAAAGRVLAIVGPSGAGKTSILRAVAGLLRPREGRVLCDGRIWLDTASGVDVPPEKRGCGYVFQDYALFGHMSAWRNVAYGLAHMPRAGRRERALELLGRFGLSELAEARPATLSGASASGWRSPARSVRAPRRCFSTSPFPPSTRAPGHAPPASFVTSPSRRLSRRCWSRTTSRRRARSPTRSP